MFQLYIYMLDEEALKDFYLRAYNIFRGQKRLKRFVYRAEDLFTFLAVFTGSVSLIVAILRFLAKRKVIEVPTLFISLSSLVLSIVGFLLISIFLFIPTVIEMIQKPGIRAKYELLNEEVNSSLSGFSKGYLVEEGKPPFIAETGKEFLDGILSINSESTEANQNLDLDNFMEATLAHMDLEAISEEKIRKNIENRVITLQGIKARFSKIMNTRPDCNEQYRPGVLLINMLDGLRELEAFVEELQSLNEYAKSSKFDISTRQGASSHEDSRLPEQQRHTTDSSAEDLEGELASLKKSMQGARRILIKHIGSSKKACNNS